MIKMNRRSALKTSALSFVGAALPRWSSAQTSSYGPDDLKSTLTPFGAVRAGNADGTIPPWTGGYSEVPPGYKQGDPRPIPFADEKPLYSITADNAAGYSDKLPAGVMAIFQKYPDYRIDVYPTHRTAVAPQYVYDYTYKNASTAKLSADGNSVFGAYGGLPFPIPQNGHEVMWNHLLAWEGVNIYYISDAYTITAAGEKVFESRARAWEKYGYYVENGEANFNGNYFYALIEPIAPPFQAGNSILLHSPVDPIVTPVEGWEYLLGQRRVRRAPELQYDTPNSVTGGITNWDESYGFSGKLDEYDCQLVGKKEMYVIYNANQSWAATVADQFKPHFFNPDITRWELHRVWVVEMTLKSGARNVDTRRTMYCDEDTGTVLSVDVYDASGALWKFMQKLVAILPDVPAVVGHKSFISYDLHAGDYSASDIPNADAQPAYEIVPEIPDSFFTPGQLSATSGGF